MNHNVKAPSVGESITEVSILKWAKQNGEQVKTGDLLLEVESDKATVEIVAEASGALTILKPAGERIPVGEIIGIIDDAMQGSVSKPTSVTPSTPLTSALSLGPAARKAIAEQGLDTHPISGTGKGGRITKGDVIQHLAKSVDKPGDRRVPMSMLRARIAERLVQAQHTAAILTTFNEVDMSSVIEIRNKNKDAFKAKHEVALSFMSFFTLAALEALKAVPEVNASTDGKDIIYHDHYDIGVAVGTDRGLVVPIIRNAEKMSLIELEKKIAEYALKGRTGKLSIAELSGGSFTISNGGVYGSLLSTPILNPPQSGILGMHKIQERPMAIQGKVEIRPMMYLALSYDHRLIDGKGAVTFLITLKDSIEHPEKLKLELGL